MPDKFPELLRLTQVFHFHLSVLYKSKYLLGCLFFSVIQMHCLPVFHLSGKQSRSGHRTYSSFPDWKRKFPPLLLPVFQHLKLSHKYLFQNSEYMYPPESYGIDTVHSHRSQSVPQRYRPVLSLPLHLPVQHYRL